MLLFNMIVNNNELNFNKAVYSINTTSLIQHYFYINIANLSYKKYFVFLLIFSQD